MRRVAVGLALLTFAEPSLACSCAREEFATTEQSRRLVAAAEDRFPVALDGRVIGVERPMICRVAPIRWVAALGGTKARIAYRVHVERVLRGVATKTITVIREEQVTSGGCVPRGSTGCEPVFGPKPQLWALRSVPGGYKRATTCTERLALTRLG